MFKPKMMLGIDFGTSNCFVATMNGKYPYTEITDPATGVPSLYYRGADGNEFYGEDAKPYAVIDSANFIQNIKRLIREDAHLLDEENQRKWTIANFTTNEIVEKMIKSLIENAKKKAANQEIGRYIDTSEISHITITAPAGLGQDATSANSYNTFLRKVVQKVTGLNKRYIHIIEEPKAAAIAYLYENKTDHDQTILVYDLGGGTVDVSIVEFKSKNETYCVKTTAGNTKVGGIDWDNALDNLVHKKTGEKPNSAKEKAMYRKNLVELKHYLSGMELGAISFNDNRCQTTVSRDEFERATRDLLELTFAEVDKALQLYKGAIDKVVMVGGASQMPQIKARMIQQFPELNENDIIAYKSSSAISIGAAINSYMESLSISPIKDVATHSYGINASVDGSEKISNIILKDDSPDSNGQITGARRYKPLVNDQKYVSGTVYEHDEKSLFTEFDTEGVHEREEKFTIRVPSEYQGRACDYGFEVRLTWQENIVDVKITDEFGVVEQIKR